MHYETTFSQMKNLEIHENYLTLFCLEKVNFFLQYYINSELCIVYSQSDWNNY